MTATDARSDLPAPGPSGDGLPAPRTTPPVPDAAAEPLPPAGSADDDRLDAGEALPRLVRIAGEVVAPATLLTALLFQFGRLHAAGYYRHFGVNFTVLDPTLQDHLVSGADGLFVPLAGTCVVALALLWVHRFLLSRLPGRARARALRVLPPVAAVLGAVLLLLALLDLLTDMRLFWGDGEAGGLALAGGVLLLVYALRLVRVAHGATRRSESAELAEWGVAFLLVSVGLYWAVGQYAFGVGTGRAEQLQRALPDQPAAVLYSERSLSLGAEGVTEVRCADPEAAYRFRYDGLRLVRQSGGQYLLVAATWTRDTGSAVLVPRGDGVRLEFRTATTPPDPC